MIEGRCSFPGCERFPWQNHHVVYASNDPRHSECRKEGCDYRHCEAEHPEKTAILCAEHHKMITLINIHIWLHKGRHVLTCREREYWWGRFLAGYAVKANRYSQRYVDKMGEIE